MKKIFIILFTVSLFLNFSFFIYAEEIKDKSVSYICLNREKCSNEGVNCTTRNGHRVRLTTNPQKKFPSNKEVYIAECLYYVETGKSDYRCTTGNQNLDKIIWGEGYNGFNELQNKFKYSLSGNDPKLGGELGIFKIENNRAVKINPQTFTTNTAGETPILEWQSYTEKELERKWYGFFIAQNTEELKMGQGGLQQGKVEFPPFQDQDCATVAWDPAGRVFDAKTLEPIPNVQVMLLKNYDGQFTDARRTELTIVNPYITLENGGFSFYVSSGQYKLTASHPNYSFPITNLNDIHQNYQQIYLNPRYGKPGEPKTLIYPIETDEIINVSNRIEFRDIPLKPNNNIGYSYPLNIYSFSQQLNKSTQEIVFSGKASHPFTKVTLYKKIIENNNQEKNQIFDSYLSDHLGSFKFSIPLSKLRENELINNAQFEKSNLKNLNYNNKQTLINKFKNFFSKAIKNVFAQQNDIINIEINPTLPHLEGFVYDNKEKILPNTKIGVYLTFSNIPYYTTTTDEKGYFKIPSTRLPNEPYEIRYQTKDKETIKLSTSKFFKQNAPYLVKNKINLNQIVDEKGKVITPTKISPTKTKTEIERISIYPSSYNPRSQSSVSSNSQNPSSSLTNNKSNLVLLTVLILLILIITVFALLFFYYQKNKSQPQI